MKKGLLLLVLMLGSLSFATVDLRTFIREVEVGGSEERVGQIIFDIREDDFANASPANPVYIALRFDRNAKLSGTLVDIQSSPMGHDPVALPVAVQTQSATTLINIPENGVSIVRWRAGESRIWLKVTASSSTWVDRDGTFGPPSGDDRVFFVLGQTFTEAEDRFGDLFDQGQANLVGPTRHGGDEVDAATFVDLTQSNIQPAPHPESLLSFDPISYDGSTAGVDTSATEAGIQTGSLTFPAYSGDTTVARAFGLSQSRWIYYFSTYRGDFVGDAIFYNRFPAATTMTLRPFDRDGNALADVDVEVDGGSLKSVPVASLFGNLPVTHCQIIGVEQCAVTVSHRSNYSSLTTHIPEGDGGQFYWEYFPEDLRLGKDYLVLVNLGAEAATLQVTMVNENGIPIEAKILFENEAIPPKGRAVISLKKLPAKPGDVAMFRFSGTQKFGVTAWRSSRIRNGVRCLVTAPIIKPGL